MATDPSNHPITKLEKLVLAHFWGESYPGEYPDMERIRITQPEDYEQIAALTALCREYAASELRAAAGEDDDVLNVWVPNGWEALDRDKALAFVAQVRNELRHTLRVRADELEATHDQQ